MRERESQALLARRALWGSTSLTQPAPCVRWRRVSHSASFGPAILNQAVLDCCNLMATNQPRWRLWIRASLRLASLSAARR